MLHHHFSLFDFVQQDMTLTDWPNIKPYNLFIIEGESGSSATLGQVMEITAVNVDIKGQDLLHIMVLYGEGCLMMRENK